MKIRDICNAIEEIAPLAYQESYDNAGLLIGDPEDSVNSALITLDVTEAVIDEAIRLNCGLIIAHHPFIFHGLKRLNGKDATERCAIRAIQNHIAIYASHTNMDSVPGGVNDRMADKLGLVNRSVLSPVSNQLEKLVTFVPVAQAEKVRKALFDAGAGTIGNYDQCSYNIQGKGTFRGNDQTHPFVGRPGKLHFEEETRIEIILPKLIRNQVIRALLANHPYEEPAYDLYPLDNVFHSVGIGVVGDLPEEENETLFLQRVKSIFNCPVIRHTRLLKRPIKKVALCGGSGSSLLTDAITSGADLFITGDFKYHQFFDAGDSLIIADIGHFESEQFTKEVFYEIVRKKFPKFALHLSDINTNPINYLI